MQTAQQLGFLGLITVKDVRRMGNNSTGHRACFIHLSNVCRRKVFAFMKFREIHLPAEINVRIPADVIFKAVESKRNFKLLGNFCYNSLIYFFCCIMPTDGSNNFLIGLP